MKGGGDLQKLSNELKTFTVHTHMKMHALAYRGTPPSFRWIYKIIQVMFTFLSP